MGPRPSGSVQGFRQRFGSQGQEGSSGDERSSDSAPEHYLPQKARQTATSEISRKPSQTSTMVRPGPCRHRSDYVRRTYTLSD